MMTVDRNKVQAIAAKVGLKAIKLGMRVNTSYTPKRCMEVARELTGVQYKPRDYDGAIKGLEAYLEKGA